MSSNLYFDWKNNPYITIVIILLGQEFGFITKIVMSPLLEILTLTRKQYYQPFK